MALAGRVAYNVVYNAIAKIISTALALVAIGMITRYLGKDGFGNYATMLAFFAFFNAIGDMGLQTVTAREISRKDADENTLMSSILTLRILISVSIVCITPAIIYFLPYSHDLKLAIILASVAFVFSSLSMTLNGIFQKHLAMDTVATIELGGKLVQIAIIYYAVTHNLSFIYVAAGLLGYMAFNAIFVFWKSREFFRFVPKLETTFWRKFLRQSLPIGIASIVSFAYFKADTIMLSFMKTSADVGIYNAAYKVIENLIFFPAMVAGLILPLLSRYIFVEPEKFTIIANKTFKVFLVLVVPLVIGVSFLAPQIIAIIGGPGYEDSVAVLRILVFALACIFFGQFFNTILIVSNNQSRLMRALFIAAIINITANLIVIPRFSYIGAAYTSVFTELAVVMMSGFLVYKYSHYKPSTPHFSRILFAGFLMAIYLWFFSHLHLALLIIGSIIIYLSTLWLTNAIEKEELLQVLAGSKFSRGIVSE